MAENKQEKITYSKVKTLKHSKVSMTFLVERKPLSKLVVLKEISANHLSEKEKWTHVVGTKIMETLNHPNIVNVIEVYKTKNQKIYVVMDHCQGGDLLSEIKKQQKKEQLWTEEAILNLFAQICMAVKHFHDRKLVHRNLKSSSIFFTEDGTV